MSAWLPQASYPCGNFSDTSSFKFRRSKGSIGHAFTVRIRTENQNQTSFYPFVPHEISVLVELILGHLRYLLTDVPPQPNSPPDNVLRPDRPAEASLGSKRRGCYPASDSRRGMGDLDGAPTQAEINAQLLANHAELKPRLLRWLFGAGKARKSRSQSVPGRHEAVARHVSGSSSPPTVDGFGTGTPEPSPQSQSFSRSYGSILPTSLAYIVPSTRGCSPWRPDAVMSTTGRERHSVLRIFKGAGMHGHHATRGALPAAGPYLRLSRFRRAVGHRNPASVHPASPVLLTKNGPLGALDSVGWLNKAATRPTYLKFENRSRALRPDASNHWLYPIELVSSSSYLRKLRRNQLLDGSISLSPYTQVRRAICTSVSLRASTRVSSGRPLRHSSPSFGSRQHAHTRTLLGRSRSVGCAPVRIQPISFLTPYGFTHPLTRTHVRLLGPCFKAGRMGSPQAGARARRCRGTPWRVLQTTIKAAASPLA
ncbi:hypothetical protein Bca101_090338 [Brassica carinata]